MQVLKSSMSKILLLTFVLLCREGAGSGGSLWLVWRRENGGLGLRCGGKWAGGLRGFFLGLSYWDFLTMVGNRDIEPRI